MQVQFVWYHYYDAQEAFNSIRCYIAAYVWMTGFGKSISMSSTKVKCNALPDCDALHEYAILVLPSSPLYFWYRQELIGKYVN